MRVLLDIRTVSDHFPGIGRYSYHLARALAPCLADEDELVLLHNPELANTRYDLAALPAEGRVRVVQTSARPFSPGEQLLLPRELRRLAPAVSHFPYAVMPYAAPRPLVLTIHDVIPARLPRYFSAWQRVVYRLTTWLALRAAARVICVSAATRDDLLDLFRVDAGRVAVVHEGVGPRFVPCAPDEIARVRARYGLPVGYVLYLGTNKPHKNLPALVEAYAQLVDAPALVLAGAHEARYPQARARAELLGLGQKVHFAGAIADEDLPALYSGAQLFAFVSQYEGFGLPPLEAMACGTPVLCANIPSLSEVVGDAALRVDPQARDAIAEGLDRALGDPALRATLRARGLARAAEFGWERAARETLAIYRQVVTG